MKPVEKGPVRTCVACRESKQQDQLVRYVVAPDGTLVIDYRHRLPGRGVYTCFSDSCLKTAVDRGLFSRGLRGSCKQVDFDALRVELNTVLQQRIINLLGMARKSGQIVSGSNAAMTALRHGSDFALVLMTKDISIAIADKIQVLAQRQGIDCSQLLNKDRLGQILGKGERSVVAVQKGALAEALLIELHRYKQLVREN